MSEKNPRTRKEKALAKAAAGETLTPRDWEEKMIAEAAAGTDPRTAAREHVDLFYQEISGGGVTVEPLSVTANDTYTAPSGKAYSPVTVAVPNPNSIVTVTGTLADPWGDLSFADINTAYVAHDLSLELSIENYGDFSPTRFNSARYFERVATASSSSVSCMHGAYNADGTLNAFRVVNATAGLQYNYSEIPSDTNTVLTVIYHPMPEAE